MRAGPITPNPYSMDLFVSQSARFCAPAKILTLVIPLGFSIVQYTETDRTRLVFPTVEPPEDLRGKVNLLTYLSNYMEKHLLKVSATPLFGITLLFLKTSLDFDRKSKNLSEIDLEFS